MRGLIKITGACLLGAMAVVVAVILSFSGCSKGSDRENAFVPGGGSAEPDRSGQLKVQTSVLTRSAVDGTVLPQGSAIGAVVTTPDGSAFFTPAAASGSGSADGGYYADGRNVRFTNGTGVNTWTSTSAEGKTKLLLFSGEDEGKVYGYYPWTEDGDIEGEGSSATVPVGILNEGTIAVNAADAAADRPAFTAKEEIDYMYSSRSDEVGAATTTTARLEMVHVLSRVSFRMYASAAAQTAVEGDAASYYEFTGYTLRNRSGSEDLHARFDGNTRMSVSTGKITGALSGGEYVRRLEGYRLVRSKAEGETANNAAAKGSPRVGHLCFPLASIGHDGGKTTGLEVVFEVRRMRGDGSVGQDPAAYALPLAVVPGQSDTWEAGKHYTYTVKFTGSSLSIESVRVTDWNEVLGGDMTIGEDPYVSSAEVTPEGDIPGQGGTYSVTLNGLLSLYGTQVRACVDGREEPLAEGKATTSGSAVELAVPANMSYAKKTVSFEYKLGDDWHPIGEVRSQLAWHVTKVTHDAPDTAIPQAGGTYTVSFEGWGDYQVRAMSGDTQVAINTTVNDDPTKTVCTHTIAVPANTGNSRPIQFQYRFNGTWTDIPPTVAQAIGGISSISYSACEEQCKDLGGIPTKEEAEQMDWEGWITERDDDNSWVWTCTPWERDPKLAGHGRKKCWGVYYGRPYAISKRM